MQLSFEQICEITNGAVSLSETEKGICFHRFTIEQSKLYANKDEKFYRKSKTSSGVKLHFQTDSQSLRIAFLVDEHIGASFISFDIYVDGIMRRSVNNFDGISLPRNYLKMDFPIGEFYDCLDLNAGMKEICIHLPWNACAYLRELTLDDGAALVPVKLPKKLLALGDSITYGNAAMHPSARYIARLCNALGAEEFNKGIGGEFFCPDLAATKESFLPDYIVVAYGTNDWRKLPRDIFFRNVHAFFRQLHETYPGIKTIVITPIWRSNLHAETDFSSIDEVIKAIKDAAQVLEDKLIVDGFDLVPHDVEFYGDYGCHPNDRGFEEYFRNLWLKIKNGI